MKMAKCTIIFIKNPAGQNISKFTKFNPIFKELGAENVLGLKGPRHE